MNAHRYVLIVVPARRDSERLPNKPLVDLEGVPMVVRTYRQALEGLRRSGIEGAVRVATDCLEIARTVHEWGGEAILTEEDHVSGTSRCREALDACVRMEQMQPDWVMNVQGDEPLVDPDHVAALVRAKGPIATLFTAVGDHESTDDRSVCYVVSNATGSAQYFSRWPIPFWRTEEKAPRKRHLGVYAYEPAVLKQLVALPPAPEERSESLEQLRWLHHGFAIQLVEVGFAHGGVDTPSDAERVRHFLRSEDVSNR